MERLSSMSVEERREWLRLIGGLVFALGAVVLFFRKSGSFGADEWADFPLLLVLLVPCALLYWLGLGSAGPSQPIFLVFAVLLVPLVLFQLLALLDGDTNDSLNTAWIFAVTAGLAAFAAVRAGVAYQALLSALALLIAWLALWDKLLDGPSTDTLRVLLIVLGAIYLALAVTRRLPYPAELVTAAGIAGVAAGLLGALDLVGGFVGQLVGGESEAEGQSVLWDVFLLVTSIVLVSYAARGGGRGPAYVGAVGLAGFSLLVGSEVGELATGGEREGKVVGWPLVLLLAGAAALTLGTLRPPRSPASPAPAGDPGAPPADSPPVTSPGPPAEPRPPAGGPAPPTSQ